MDWYDIHNPLHYVLRYSGGRELKVVPVPDRFVLQQDEPEPFAPITDRDIRFTTAMWEEL